MATRTAKRAKPKTQEARPEIEAPIGWTDLLHEAVNTPGMISKAFTTFHNYSIGNAMLMLFQAHARGLELGPAAAYGKWVSLGRQVRKGEKALWVNAPRMAKRSETDPSTGEKREVKRVFFVLVPGVFLLSQTDPIQDVEDKSATLMTQTGEVWDRDRAMQALELTFGEFRQLDGNLAGFFDPATRNIVLNPVSPHQDRTLVHEMAHSILHENGYAGCESRGVAEVEAESVALLVSDALGLGGADEARGYVQHWLRTTDHEDLTEAMVRRVFSAAQKILAAGLPAKQEAETA